MALAAKAAADIERDATDPRLRQTEEARRFTAYPMNHLGRRPDRRRVGAPIIGGDDTAALHRHRGVAVVVEAALQTVGRRGECHVDLAPADREGADQVRAVSLVNDRAVGTQRRLGVDHRRERFEVAGHKLGRVFGLVTGFGDDDRDRLADMADLVMRQQRLLRVEEFVLDRRRPFARHRNLPLGHRRQQSQQIGAVEREHDAGHRRRSRQIDRADAGMRHRAAHEDRVQHSRQDEIGDELPLAGQQAPVFAPQQRAPDIRGSDVIHGSNLRCHRASLWELPAEVQPSRPLRPLASEPNRADFQTGSVAPRRRLRFPRL